MNEQERTVYWLRRNSRTMEEFLGKGKAMGKADYMPEHYTNEQIWNRYMNDWVIGLTNQYFVREYKPKSFPWFKVVSWSLIGFGWVYFGWRFLL